jgi:glycine hydroxymethyltransferase
LQFGAEYAAQVVRNARALAEALAGAGLSVLGEKLGFTRSHQVAVDVAEFGDGGTLEQTLERANIIVNRQLLPGDIQAGRHYMHPGGIRLGVQELTRLGMRDSEMRQVAEFLSRVVVRKENPELVARDVAEFRRSYQGIHYAFESAREAYAYFRLR